MLYDSAFYGPTFTVDTLTINGSTDANGCDWILTSEKGWFQKPAPKQNRVDKPAARGTYIGSEHPGSRVVTLGFRLTAPDVATLRNAQDQVLGLCADSATLYPLTCTDERGITLSALAKLDAEILITPVAWNTVDVSLQLVCPDPRKTSTALNVVTTGLVAAGTNGVSYPVAYPVNYGTPGASGSLVLTNRGNAPADMILTLVGPTTLPTLTNPSTNDVTAYTGNLTASDKLVINTASGRVLLNGIDRRNLLSVVVWPRIPANGSLKLLFTSNNNADTGTVVATSYDTYY